MGYTAADYALRADLDAPDHFPTCPRCGDLLEPDALVCVECGTRTMETDADERALLRAEAALRLRGVIV